MRYRTVLLAAALSAQGAAAQSPLQQADAHFQASRWAEAERAYLDILKQDSTSSVAWYRLGRVYQEGKRDQTRALAHFQGALRHGFAPGFFPRFGMARAYVLMGKNDDALGLLELMAKNGLPQPDAVTGDSILRRLSASARYAAVVELMTRNAQPCEYLAESRQLDFWIGMWDVYSPQGMKLGTNRIDKLLRGCALQENWIDGFGHEGKSFNFFDPQRKTWRQVWVGDTHSTLDYREGEFRDRAMHFSGLSISPQGDTTLQKLTFTNVHADTVYQVFSASTDRGKTWAETWRGIYVRRK